MKTRRISTSRMLIERLALGIVRFGRWLFRGTPIQRLPFTTWLYRRVAGVAMGTQTERHIVFRELELVVPAKDITITPTLVTGEYERAAIDAFLRLPLSGGTVIDVGANIGVYSLLAARAVGSEGTVVAFEPVRENRDLALANAARNGVENIELVEKAVGNTEGKVTLYHSRIDAGTHSVGLGTGFAEEVDVVRLDEWTSQAGLASVDMLKIDVEGFDGFVLDGARELIARWEPSILVEYVPRQLIACGDDPDRVAGLLLELPGNCFAVDESRRRLVPLSTPEELKSTLGVAGGNVLVTSSVDLLDQPGG